MDGNTNLAISKICNVTVLNERYIVASIVYATKDEECVDFK